MDCQRFPQRPVRNGGFLVEKEGRVWGDFQENGRAYYLAGTRIFDILSLCTAVICPNKDFSFNI
jgi:hypothetical protein